MRVIKAVLKSAWRDGWSGLDFGASPLRDARDYRSAEWWQTVCALEPPSKRRRQGIQHRHPGKSSTSWEHPFVQVWGIHWKNKRNACGNLMQWMRLYPEFSQSICDKWSLCMLPVSNPAQSEQGPFTVKLPTGIADVPELLPCPRNCSWESAQGRLWVRTSRSDRA